MNLFKKMFGRETAAELEASAETAAATHQPGIAKLTFERALERATDDESKARISARIREMRDLIARSRLQEAARLIESESIDEAAGEIRGAAEVAADPEIVRAADEMLERLRAAVTMEGVTKPRLHSHVELVAAATAGWVDDQAVEFEALGEEMIEAAVAMEDGRFEEARARLESILTTAPSPRFLCREVARARWATGDALGANEAFEKFFEAVTSEEHDRMLFEARLDRARLLDELERGEDALIEIEKALEHAGDSPRAFVAAAQFLRDHHHVADAHGVLEAALELPTGPSDRFVQIELALCEAALDRADDARLRLERVALDDRQRGYEPPRELEGTRAALLAKVGRREHAAELFRRLALAATDSVAFEHAKAAARLHGELGHVDEARRLYDRADRLAPSAKDKEDVESARAALG